MTSPSTLCLWEFSLAHSKHAYAFHANTNDSSSKYITATGSLKSIFSTKLHEPIIKSQSLNTYMTLHLTGGNVGHKVNFAK